jgi:hypothetical protein
MAAPIGNEFWKLRSKHGKDKIFTSPEILKQACYEYFSWCEGTPLKEHDFVGKDAIEVHRNKMRAFTLSGLCIFLDVNTKYFNDFNDGIRGKDDEISKEYSEVITQVMDIIYTQKFTGAAAGFLNPNIIARDLGLADKKEIGHKIEEGAIVDWSNNGSDEQKGNTTV